MSRVINNMSAPPSSIVHYDFLPTSDSYIFISIYDIAEYIDSPMFLLVERLNKYIKSHKKKLESISPKQFMIVKHFEAKNKIDADKLKKNLSKPYPIAKSISGDKQIAILSKIVGDLYIPNRPPHFDKEILTSVYLISKEELDNDK